MKFVFFILLLSLFSYTFSQKDSIIVKGNVSNTESKSLKNALVHLVSSVGHRYEYKTDSVGNYRFRFYSESPFSCTITIASDKNTTSGKDRCVGFLASKDNAVFELVPGKIFEKNFTLAKVLNCGPISPSIIFYTNSIKSCNDSLSMRDSIQYVDFYGTISILHNQLNENPGLMIEIAGHASSMEKNSEQLSLYRAQLIREILIVKGINGNRITTKGWGNSKLLIREDIIKKAKTKEEKAALHTRNQRVVYRIVSWDFKE